MRSIILSFVVSIPFFSFSQTLKVYNDQGQQHGYEIFDTKFDHTTYTRSQMNKIIDSINNKSAGWRLPTVKEMGEIFKATYDKRQLRSTLTASTCYTADILTSDIGGKPDTVNTIGIMRGREFQSGPPMASFNQEIRESFFLIKDF